MVGCPEMDNTQQMQAFEHVYGGEQWVYFTLATYVHLVYYLVYHYITCL